MGSNGISMAEENHDTKYVVLQRMYEEISHKRSQHEKMFKKLKKCDDGLEVTTNILDAVTVTSIVISFSGLYPVLISSLCTSSVSFLIKSGQRAYNLKEKYTKYLSTSNQLYELQHDIEVTLSANGLTRNEIQAVIGNIRDRLALINDNALPVEADTNTHSFRIPRLTTRN